MSDKRKDKPVVDKGTAPEAPQERCPTCGQAGKSIQGESQSDPQQHRFQYRCGNDHTWWGPWIADE